ncbi:MAG: lipid II flippase MurJ, partial [Deltaproteobacteria bacterium]
MFKNIFATVRAAPRDSFGHKILGAAITVSLGPSLVTLLFFGKELVVASWFGTDDAIEAFLIAFLIPTFVSIVARHSTDLALVPTFIRVREREGPAAAQRLFSQVLTIVLVLLVALAAVLALAAPWLLSVMASGFASAKLALTRSLFYLMLPTAVMGGVSAFWATILAARERFAPASLSPGMWPVGAVVGLWLFGARYGIFALAGGTFIGFLLEMIVLGAVLKTEGMHLMPQWQGVDPNVREVGRHYAPIGAAVVAAASIGIIDQAMAATLGPGSVASLNYGGKVVGSLCALGPMALGTAVTPYFSLYSAQGNRRGMARTFRTGVILSVLVTVPLALGIFVFSDPLIRLLFQRGAFTAQDTPLVAYIQALLAMQIPFVTLG